MRPETAAAFERFLRTVDALRDPGGCPWDREQTHRSLRPFLVEETYEVLQAIDEEDDEQLKSELGDVLLQVALHARIASEEGRFDMGDVCEAITAKLIRRHPHVFGSVEVNGVDEVLTNWEAIKAAEKAAKNDGPERSALDGVPQALPALLLALEVSKKAARQGFEWPDLDGVLDKMMEEIGELRQAIAEGRAEEVESEIGDLLFTVVNVARWVRVDPEQTLRDMVRRFSARFRAMEDRARAAGRPLGEMSPDEWEDLWQSVKRELP